MKLRFVGVKDLLLTCSYTGWRKNQDTEGENEYLHYGLAKQTDFFTKNKGTVIDSNKNYNVLQYQSVLTNGITVD
jgi:hypothetical protein